jgi:methionyl-tRNA synthetase
VSRFFLTTAIDYVNSQPHLGTAYEKIMADVIARYKRLSGVDTYFLMGNDEHSQNVFRKAQEQGVPPLEYCDRMEQEFRTTWQALDLSFDDFIRTTEPRHKSGVTYLAQRIYDRGDIYEGVYEGGYCVGCEAFKQEKDLVDGKCPLHLTVPQWITEKNYFFRLSKYQGTLQDHFDAHPEFLQPETRRNEILRLLDSGLEDISVSRAGQPWGIPLPFDPSSVVYVWFDALINYASAVGLGTDPAKLARWWPADLHVIGKDITRFHMVIWPAMLISGGLDIPRQVFGHGFLTLDGQRMSKTLGTTVNPLEAASRFGPDPLRLYLVKEIAFGGDGDFSWSRYEERYNVDLANNLGNLVSRVTTMAERYRQGRLTPAGGASDRLARAGEQALVHYRAAMDRCALHEGAAAAYSLVDATNEYIAATAPWALARDAAAGDRLTQVLFDSAEAIRLAALMLTPIMPASSAEILRRVGVASDGLTLDRDGGWRAEGERLLVQGGPLWPRKEHTIMADHVTPQAPDSLAPGTSASGTPAPGAEAPATAAPATAAPAAAAPSAAAPAASAIPASGADDARITIDAFKRVELRVARVLSAERVAKSKKLLKLSVDVGSEHRTIVAGIADSYEPEALVGRTIAVVFNLQPAKLMGIESNGMVLAASPDGGKAVLVSFDQPLAPGTPIR